MTFTAGSLFSGIGGIDVAFAAAGFDIRFQVEIDDYCRKVLSKHAPRYWPNAAQHVDIRDVGRAELGTVDVLFGGFPCQDISVAGNGAGLEGARSGLWLEFRRIIGDIRPRFVFIENVPAITSRGGTTVIAHLAALGYDARWGVVSAASAGAPHQRDRWFCVAHAVGVERWCSSVGDIRERSAGEWFRRDIRDGFADSSIAVLADHHDGNDRQTVSGINEQASGDGRIDAGRPDAALSTTQSRLARSDDGLFGWLDRPRFPAGRGQPQHEWEPARQLVAKGTHWTSRVHALGNAVVPQVVYPFAVEIMRQLAEAESHGD